MHRWAAVKQRMVCLVIEAGADKEHKANNIHNCPITGMGRFVVVRREKKKEKAEVKEERKTII